MWLQPVKLLKKSSRQIAPLKCCTYALFVILFQLATYLHIPSNSGIISSLLFSILDCSKSMAWKCGSVAVSGLLLRIITEWFMAWDDISMLRISLPQIAIDRLMTNCIVKLLCSWWRCSSRRNSFWDIKECLTRRSDTMTHYGLQSFRNSAAIIRKPFMYQYLSTLKLITL